MYYFLRRHLRLHYAPGMLCELTDFPVIAFPSFLTCFCFYPGMNQGLRVLQGTLHGNGDEDRFSDVGDGIVGT